MSRQFWGTQSGPETPLARLEADAILGRLVYIRGVWWTCIEADDRLVVLERRGARASRVFTHQEIQVSLAAGTATIE